MSVTSPVFTAAVVSNRTLSTPMIDSTRPPPFRTISNVSV